MYCVASKVGVLRGTVRIGGASMPMRIGTELPSLSGATEWALGSESEALASIAGHPTLIHFWSVSCGICKENMPKVAEWRDGRYDEGLRVIAIHMPRYPIDSDVEAVKVAIEKHGFTEPCAIDNMHALRDAFQNEPGYVPAYYLFDEQGKLKSFAAGERGLGMLSAALERMLTGRSRQPVKAVG